jgi:hypothetical protein
MKISVFVSALALGMFVSSAAFALDAATPVKPEATTAPKPDTTTSAKPDATTAAKPDAAAKAERAAECSKRADAKGYHGKKRREFREECKKGKEDKDIIIK